MYRNLVKTVVFNQTVVFLPYLHCMYYLHEWRGWPDVRDGERRNLQTNSEA